MIANRIARAILVLLLAAAAAGCERKVQLVPEGSDSTRHFIDSSAVRVRQVQERWEAAAEPEEASALTARLLSERLAGLPPAMWKSTTDALLDSLGIGSESASGPCALAVNFFVRSDPAGGSWPFVLWCGEQGPRFQAIEGRQLRLLALGSRGLEAPPDSGVVPGIAVLFARRGGGGQQPLLMMWEAAGPGRWSLKQTLGPDSLGGVGSGEFEAFADTAIDLVARTYRVPRGFEECATCPHMFTVHRFRWRPSGFVRLEQTPVPSPYSSFVRFIAALTANDREAAARLVGNEDLVDEAQQMEWHRPKGAWRIAPATDETPDRMMFFRGKDEAYRVSFASRGDEWVITGVQTIPRTVE